MKRAIKSQFKCSREDLNRLFACNRISALVWNKILELQREKLCCKGDLQKALKEIQQISLIWGGRLKLAIVIDDGKENAPAVQTDVTCGIDLGEIHSIAGFSSEGNAIIITGRLLRSVKQYQLKKLAEFGRKLSKCKTNSRRTKKLRRAKRRILQKTNARISDLNHKITRTFVTWAIENKIAKVFVGNPEGVQRKKRRRVINQKLSRWNFGKHLEYLTYKLASVGIVPEKISEAYSTQTCPVCGRRHKCNSRNYKCSCGYSAHRDIHGARNILSLGLNGRICITTPIKDKKYLRTA